MTVDLGAAVHENSALGILVDALVDTEREKSHDIEITIGGSYTKRLVSIEIEDVEAATAVVANDDTKLITGGTVDVDGEHHILG